MDADEWFQPSRHRNHPSAPANRVTDSGASPKKTPGHGVFHLSGPDSATNPLPDKVQPLAPPWRELWRFDVLDSTQRYAVRQIRAGRPLQGIVVRADRQTAGHGRRERTWESSGGGLYVTAVLPTSPPPVDQLGWLPLASAVFAAQVLRERWELPAMVKWPNDLLIDGHKVGGLLGDVVHGSGPGRTASALIGFGLNGFNPVDRIEPVGGYRATRLGDHVSGLNAGHLDWFLPRWLERLARFAQSLAADAPGTAHTIRDDAERILWQRGGQVTFDHTENGQVYGVLEGLGYGGAARLRIEGEGTREIHCGWQMKPTDSLATDP